jgi:hypothetical protein
LTTGDQKPPGPASKPSKARKRATRRAGRQKQATRPDDNLPAALRALQDAAHDLIGPRADDGHRLPSRYAALRSAMYGSRDSHARSAPSSVIPAWIDAMKLLIVIDRRAGQLEHEWPPRCGLRPCCAGHHDCALIRSNASAYPTVRRINQVIVVRWRPQDADAVTRIADQLVGYAKAIDDLFAAKPIFLPKPCPRCGADHAYRLTDDGQRIRTPALAVTVAGAVCLHCHDTWPPENLLFLGRVLGHHIEGVIT